MRKKIAGFLLGGVCFFAAAGSVGAVTTSVDLGGTGKDSQSVLWYFTEDKGYGYDTAVREEYAVEAKKAESVEDEKERPAGNAEGVSEGTGTMMEYGDFSEIQGLSQEDREKLENWHKEEMRQQIAYLEKYGVSYDAEKDQILYQGKTVRWLIDNQIDNNAMAIQMPEGEIDLYTVRGEDFKLEGVRVASQEEYKKRTETGVVWDKTEAAGNIEATVDDTALLDGGYFLGECIEIQAERAEEQACETAQDVIEETAVESAPLTKEEQEENMRRAEKYEAAGIECDPRNGCWLWADKPIHLLLDEDGSLYQNGSDEALKDKIYVIVKRSADGTIKEAKQVTVEEVLKEKILMDQE